MSVGTKLSYQRQRRLGILRSAQPPKPVPISPLESKYYLSDIQGFGFSKCGEDRMLASKIPLHSKTRRLHQVRAENGVKQMRIHSASDVNHKRDINKEYYSLRCSTAPSSRTVRDFLKDKVGVLNEKKMEPKFAEGQQAKVVLLGTPRCRNRLATFPTLDPRPPLHPQTPTSARAFEKIETIHSSNRQSTCDVTNSFSKSVPDQRSSLHLRRTASAPAEVYRLASSKPIDDSVGNKNKLSRFRFESCSSARTGFNSRRGIQTKSILRHSLSSHSNSGKIIPKTHEPLKIDDKPLDIVGEPCRSNKPPTYLKPSYTPPPRRSGLPKSIEIPQKYEPHPPNEPPQSSICVVPFTPSNPYTGCSCRSVRFNCTGNLIHEYMENEPVSPEKGLKENLINPKGQIQD